MSADERRENLIAHALHSYVELGLGRAGHGDVARRAGVSTGTVFNYFPTREALTEAVLERVRAGSRSIFEGFAPPTGRVSDDMEAMRASLEAACAEDPVPHKLFLSWSRSFNPDLRPGYIAFRDTLIERIVPYVGARKTREEALTDARILYATSIMYIQMHFDGTDPAVMGRIATRLANWLDNC